jgi:hypothetical protein
VHKGKHLEQLATDITHALFTNPLRRPLIEVTASLIGPAAAPPASFQ